MNLLHFCSVFEIKKKIKFYAKKLKSKKKIIVRNKTKKIENNLFFVSLSFSDNVSFALKLTLILLTAFSFTSICITPLMLFENTHTNYFINVQSKHGLQDSSCLPGMK